MSDFGENGITQDTKVNVCLQFLKYMRRCCAMCIGISEKVTSTIGVKQGCSLSPTFLGLYINEKYSQLVCKARSD